MIIQSRVFSILCFSCVFTFSSLIQAQESPERPPNIIFIMADDLGYGDLGCYGQERIQTPHIDQLAKEGMRFTEAYAGSTVCAPSRCALMTGLHTGHCRIRGNKDVPLLPEDITVAELLKSAGYTTALIGKWGLGDANTTGIPNAQGFDYFYGYLNQRNAHSYYPSFLWRNTIAEPLKNIVPEYNRAVEKIEYSHDLFANEALKFIGENVGNPFFLYLALTIPHANNEAGNEGMEVPTDAPYAEEDWPQPQKNHAAMITRMDRDVGRIMTLLKALKLEEDTIIFFTSDNGPHREGGGDPDFFDSNGAVRGIKRDLYDGGIRVPMIVRWMGQIKRGSENDLPWAFWDVMPTVADLAGVDTPPEIDGISVLPTLLGKDEDQQKHDYLYWEFHEGGFSQAIRKDEWKFVKPRDRKAEWELYNIKEDIAEEHDLAKEFPDKVEEFTEIVEQARTYNPDFPGDMLK
jgi:arylsulfatase A-like enzyme